MNRRKPRRDTRAGHDEAAVQTEAELLGAVAEEEADEADPVPREFLALEQNFWEQGVRLIAGVDEAGRGPLAGPVFAAAVILPRELVLERVDDSKRLTRGVRAELDVEIRRRALAYGIGAASSREVDRVNILNATHLAMRRALARLTIQPERIVVDGLRVEPLGPLHTAVVDGDQLVHCVACASILAKVARDNLMARLAGRYPGYGWDHNVGYSTAEHVEAIFQLGVTPHHRRSFTPVQLSLELNT